MTQVLKKSGMLQDFDENKIKRAIEKSATRVVIELTEAQKDQVCKQVKNSLLHTEVVPVSTLHNLVETALDTVEPKVAKSYREYRDNKASFARMLDKVYNKKLSLSFIGDRSNANADSAIVTTQRAIVYNELNSELYKKFFLTVEEEKAMSEGYIYIHDRGSRLDSFNCCLSDVKEILTGGFEMGNLHYNEPKTLDVAFDLIGDIIMNMASCQYGGYTISEIDKLLAPYAKKSYDKYYNESLNNLLDAMKDLGQFPLTDSQERYLETKSYEYAMKKVKRDFEQGWQGLEMKLNSVGSSRGDYPFTAVSFGLGKDRFETLCTSVALDVRKNGQGKDGFKHPVLFPKLSFLYDENLHGEGKELEWLFLEAIDCSSKSMYPDFISCTGDGYCGDIYRKYGKTISRMGCRATLAPWYVRGGFQPADENDYPIFEGRMNMGAISIHFPMILKKAQLKAEKENKNVDDTFFDELNYYCNLIRDIHKRTFDTFAEKKAGTNPMAFCQGGIYGGHFQPEEKIGREFLRPMTASFGITALNETQYLYNGKSLLEDQSFAIRILQWMDDLKKRATKEDGILYALYGTPAESLCGLQIEQYRKMFGEQEGITDKPYTSNSFHCAVYEDITPIQKQDIEYKMYHYCTGGAIQYCRYPIDYNKDAIITLVRRAMKMGFYEGINLQLDYCEECGHQFIDNDTCPKCGSDNITRIERMNGYLGYSKVHGRTMYADHKLQEFKDRKSM